MARELGRAPTGIMVSRLWVRTRITARSLESSLATRRRSPLGSRAQGPGWRPVEMGESRRRAAIAIGVTLLAWASETYTREASAVMAPAAGAEPSNMESEISVLQVSMISR